MLLVFLSLLLSCDRLCDSYYISFFPRDVYLYISLFLQIYFFHVYMLIFFLLFTIYIYIYPRPQLRYHVDINSNNSGLNMCKLDKQFTFSFLTFPLSTVYCFRYFSFFITYLYYDYNYYCVNPTEIFFRPSYAYTYCTC